MDDQTSNNIPTNYIASNLQSFVIEFSMLKKRCSPGETDQFTDLVKNIILSLNKPFCPNLAARYQLDNTELLT